MVTGIADIRDPRQRRSDFFPEPVGPRSHPQPFHAPRRLRRGFTLIEISIALLILSLLGAIGFGTMRHHAPRFRMVRAARALRADLVQMRALAVQSNRQTRLRLIADGGCADPTQHGGQWELSIGDRGYGSSRWDILPIDMEEDGRDDRQGEGLIDLSLGSRRSRDVCLWSWSEVRGPAPGNADALVFSPRGWLDNPPSDFSATGYLELTLQNQQAARQGNEDAVTILISRVGMVRLVNGAQRGEGT